MTQYHLPPEWAPQAGVMLTWPNQQNDWYPTLAENEKIFVAMALQIAAREKLIIACLDQTHIQHVKHLLEQAKVNMQQVKLWVAPSWDVWVRDHGPITVMQQQLPVLLNFIFNGWGNKYGCDQDNLVTERLHQAGAFGTTEMRSLDLVLEGGSIEVDGAGTLLTTTSCLLNKNRNPSLTHDEIEQVLCELLGVKRILWLQHGQLAGDDTDGHIDTVARFCDENTICYVTCDPKDEHYADLHAMEQQLKSFKNNHDKPYHLVPLPLPKARRDEQGKRLPATYANFLIINGAVLLPIYDDAADTNAIAALKKCFPTREIIPINSNALIHQFGSLHCASMQIPAGVLDEKN